ncbi:MAG: sulfide/dihydroorotate dehydrogenase-like FAD/NAD-binding protein [Ignavibacteriales bacterium]|nr:sulfide/dihydroorotate dehydrogenase-like FAD/NAD-binding protein [Ignavibacteriales bacterium]
MFLITHKEKLSPTITKYVIIAPFIAKKRKAGNFVIIRVEDNGERIPLTIVESNPEEGTITLIVQSIGKTTKLLATKNVGDFILDVVGPLGNATPIHLHGAVACVGGGVGTAELYPIAKALKSVGNTVYSIVGARSKDLIILENEMAEISNELFVTTDDGSYKRKGFVTDALKDLLDAPHGISAVYAIGPLPMMKAVSNLTKKYGVKTYVSLNAIMVDGTGMCGGCRVTIDGEMKFACVDGPEFDGHAVDFDELIMRNRTYTDLEQISNTQFNHETIDADLSAVAGRKEFV